MNDRDEAIKHVVDTYKAAVFAKDVRSFMGIYSPDVRVFDLWGEWSYDGAGAWHQAVKGWFGSLGTERVVVEIEVVQTFATNDLAVVQAFLIYRAVSGSGEALRAMRNRLSWVLKPVMSEWRICHEHTSAPVDPASAQVILDVGDQP